MPSGNRLHVARLLLISALIFGVLSVFSFSGTLPINRGAHRLFGIAFGICAAADALIGLILLTRSDT